MSNLEFDIDLERLRKKIMGTEFRASMFPGSDVNVLNCANAYDETPEQLIAHARRLGINLDKFKVEK